MQLLERAGAKQVLLEMCLYAGGFCPYPTPGSYPRPSSSSKWTATSVFLPLALVPVIPREYPNFSSQKSGLKYFSDSEKS
jgi:hypothetical protein